MSRRAALKEMIQEDQKTLVGLAGKADTVKAIRMEQVETRLNALKAQIKELHDEKHEVMRQPMTKEELLKTAKEELARLKEDALDRMLRNNLETAHTKNVTPFPETGTKLRILDDRVLWKAALLGVTDKDIERIVASLPDIGISATEREEKIKKIDEEIAKLSKSLETEFRELQS